MQQNEKRTKIILWAVVAAAVIGCALWLLLPHGGTTDCTAEIWIDGQWCAASICRRRRMR